MLEALCERVIPQEGEDRAEIAPWIDAAIAEDRPTGTRYEDMPDDPTAWRRGLSALEAEARARGGSAFAALAPGEQDELIEAVNAGRVADEDAWRGFPRGGSLKQIAATYYAHPKGQSEIGYGGPASPRGYVRLGTDRRDTWEAKAGKWE